MVGLVAGSASDVRLPEIVTTEQIAKQLKAKFYANFSIRNSAPLRCKKLRCQ